MVLEALAGLALGGGASFFGNQQADEARDADRKRRLAFEGTLRSSFQNDPLLNQILGGLSGLQGQTFNPDEAFSAGQEQIQLTRERREFDALRQLSAFGFDQGGPQQQFFNRALDQQQGFETAGLRNFVDQAAIETRGPQLLSDFNLFTGLLGQTLGVGGSAGILGQRAPRAPQDQLFQAGLSQNANAQEQVPQFF